MKKLLFALSIATIAIVGCKKDNTETPEGEKAPIVYEGPTQVNIEEGTNFYTVKFTANANWVAACESSSDVESESPVSIDKEKGEAGEQTIKITFNDLEAEETGRLTVFGVTTGSLEEAPKAGEGFVIYFLQGKVFVALQDEEEVSAEGGKVNVQVITNCEYTMKKYDGADQAFPWAPVTVDEANSTVTFDVQKNASYDARTAYIKFTVEAIQVPEYDDEGKQIGMTALVARVYVAQKGLAEANYAAIPAAFEGAANLSVAVVGDKVFICNGATIYEATKADMTAIKEYELVKGLDCRSIDNDDAGNLVIAVGGDYPLEEGAPYAPLQVYVIPADKLADQSALKPVIEYKDGFYGYGLANIRVTGNATKGDAIVDLVSAVGGPDGSYAVTWALKDGVFSGTNYTDFVTLPTGAAVWGSANFVAQHATTAVEGGIFYMGYDAHYDLCYNPTMSAANWQHVWKSGSSWAEGYNAIDIVEWNGKKVMAIVGMAYFPYWGMPSYLTILDVTKPAEPTVISQSQYYGSGNCYSYTTGVTLAVEGDALVAYVVDGSQCVVGSVKYPTIK